MTLYAFGSNSSGQLGIGNKDDASRPQQCLFSDTGPRDPLKIVAGGSLSMLLCASGAVYHAGVMKSVQSEAPTRGVEAVTHFEPSPLTKIHRAKLCAAAWDMFTIVTEADEVYVCGKGNKGELGLGKNVRAVDTCTQLYNFPPEGVYIRDIASSVSHTVAVLSNGEAYGWGNGRKGQLGDPSDFVWVPRRIEGLGFHIVRAVCGREFSFLVGSAWHGEAVVLGSDRWGVRSQFPGPIKNWKDVGASWGSIFVLAENGHICSWGRNDRGQLAPRNLPAVDQIAVGSEHAIALTEAGEVACWGWGEHGNCGDHTDEQGNVAFTWNSISSQTLSETQTVGGIGGGCATTFLWTRKESNEK
ncbi:uncharacterized protein KY384_005496 [Bacidia gigantensis]|uniref:uncharacterized protein n=1 Tax=Bacidia gigantensis TaxID=2732470 RepID=UPI001D050B6B|nr:uncharacterized protein KY384_005496 [Bacidia gigantensis]KAG8530014.1 hypothetical protein KY384_005496 [Bacidia gigantensis]